MKLRDVTITLSGNNLCLYVDLQHGETLPSPLLLDLSEKTAAANEWTRTTFNKAYVHWKDPTMDNRKSVVYNIEGLEEGIVHLSVL